MGGFFSGNLICRLASRFCTNPIVAVEPMAIEHLPASSVGYQHSRYVGLLAANAHPWIDERNGNEFVIVVYENAHLEPPRYALRRLSRIYYHATTVVSTLFARLRPSY
jgi:hypothetical protein